MSIIRKNTKKVCVKITGLLDPNVRNLFPPRRSLLHVSNSFPDQSTQKPTLLECLHNVCRTRQHESLYPNHTKKKKVIVRNTQRYHCHMGRLYVHFYT